MHGGKNIKLPISEPQLSPTLTNIFETKSGTVTVCYLRLKIKFAISMYLRSEVLMAVSFEAAVF